MVDNKDMALHLTRSDWKVLRIAVYPMQWLRLVICCGMALKRMGLLGQWGIWRQCYRLVKTDKVWLALCIKCMNSVVKYLFLVDILFLGVVLDLDKYIFLWQTCFLGRGHLRLEWSCIRVNMVYCKCSKLPTCTCCLVLLVEDMYM
jgi:hypothetical protein